MLSIEDSKLTDLKLSIEWDDWIEGLRKVIDDSNYHSDEVSESDAEKAQDEKDNMIRPAWNEDSNHVLHIYDKSWRSSRVSTNFIYLIVLLLLLFYLKFFTIDSVSFAVR